MGHHRPEPAIKNFRLQGRSENELASAEYFSAEKVHFTLCTRSPEQGEKKALLLVKGFRLLLVLFLFLNNYDIINITIK